jgi:hypothetical protein
MSWKDSLVWADISNLSKKKASFRKALFFVESSETILGQRNVIHKYPKKTYPYVENLGTEADEFIVTGYVVQNKDNNLNYIRERDLLIKALKDPTPGNLIHPFYGNKRVTLNGKVTFTESFSRGGIARFSIPFIEVKKIKTPNPVKTKDPVKDMDKKIEETQDNAKDGFGENYNPEEVPPEEMEGWVDSLRDLLQTVTTGLQKINPAQIARAIKEMQETYLGVDFLNICELGNDLLVLSDVFSNALGIIGGQITNNLFGPCGNLVRGIYNGPMSAAQVISTREGGETVSQVRTGFGASTLLDTNSIEESVSKETIKVIIKASKFGDPIDGETQDTSQGNLKPVDIINITTAKLFINQTAIINMARLGILSNAIKIAVRTNYTSYESAIEILNLVADTIDEQILKVGNDVDNDDLEAYNLSISDSDGYHALKSLKSKFVEIMIDIGASLARIIEYRVSADVESTLTLAYDKYEDLSRADDILKRNLNIIHPGFLPSGEIIEILNR